MKKLSVLFILPFFFFAGCNLGDGEEVSQVIVEDEVENSIGERPNVISSYPEQNASGMSAILDQIQLTFNESVTLDGCLDILNGAGVAMTQTNPSVVNTGLSYSINFGNILSPGEHYTARLRGNCVVSTATNNSMGNDYDIAFSTIKTYDITAQLLSAGDPMVNPGSDISISGDGSKVVVGGESSGTGYGLILVYEEDINSNWVNTASQSGTVTDYGKSLDMNSDGFRILVGMPFATDARLYDFSYPPATSVQLNLGIYSNSYFATSVAMSSNAQIAVSSGDANSAYIYESGFEYLLSTTYVTNLQHFGRRVALSGNGQVIAAYVLYGLYGFEIFHYSSGAAISKSQIFPSIFMDIQNFDLNDDGSILVISDSSFNTGDGIAVIYIDSNGDGNYVESQIISTPESGCFFGQDIKVSDDGNYLWISALRADVAIAGDDAGKVFRYKNDGTGNFELYAVYNSPYDPGLPKNFGWKLDISDNGKKAIIGTTQALIPSDVVIYEDIQ